MAQEMRSVRVAKVCTATEALPNSNAENGGAPRQPTRRKVLQPSFTAAAHVEGNVTKTLDHANKRGKQRKLVVAGQRASSG